MAITFRVPGPLRPYAGGDSEIVCDAPCRTVREALAALAARHPALVDRILTERGDVRPHVNVFVGDEEIGFLGGLSARLPEGATVSIVPAVSGG